MNLRAINLCIGGLFFGPRFSLEPKIGNKIIILSVANGIGGVIFIDPSLQPILSIRGLGIAYRKHGTHRCLQTVVLALTKYHRVQRDRVL